MSIQYASMPPDCHSSMLSDSDNYYHHTNGNYNNYEQIYNDSGKSR